MCCASVPPVRSSGMSVLLSGLAAVWLFVVCVSASSPHDETFRYQLLSTRRTEACTMCFGDECWTLQGDRCRYYAEVTEAIGGGQVGTASGGEVDELVHDMVGQAAASWMSQDCIPLVSHHTDCNKENICVGCKSCSCDALGKWNCKEVQRCRAEPDLDVDHRILVSVAEKLKDEISSRQKRSVNNNTDNAEAMRKISYAEIAEWMYGIKPNIDDDLEKTKSENHEAHSTIISTTEFTTDKIDKIDVYTDYIDFDEVMKNIALDNRKNKRRKPQLNETNYDFKDYMDLDETDFLKNNDTDTDKFVNILHAIVDGNENITAEPIIEESTKVVIDLLVPPKRDENVNISNIDIVDDANDTIRFDAINIMKRDVSSVMKINSTTEATRGNNTKSVTELKNNVLIPLTKIIDDKQQELKDLIKIKENLVQFINDYKKTNFDLNVKSQEIINNTKTVLSIYNLDVFPEIQFNLRKINPNSLYKLFYKLKRDIYEVIKDVVGIKKISDTKNLPSDLGNLIRAMIIYVRKQGNVTNIVQNGIKLKNDKALRRQLNNEVNVNLKSTKYYLIKILEILDKDVPQTEALSSLSPGTRKIVNRAIKNHYSDDFSVIGLRVYDPEYNLTNDLRNVGSKWQYMTANVAASAPAEKMYAMKLLHLTLSVDINKLSDALALIDFAHSRRMIPIEGSLGEKLLDKINSGLKSIDEKIQIIIRYKTSSKDLVKVDPTVKKSKRKSFLNKIRNLLRGSKKEIVELVNKKVPRSEIVKTIAKKRLDELAQKRIIEYEDTMRKWQNALNVIPRYKRALDLSRSNNRMKNIIPKYLRGKLNPAIAAKELKKTRQKTQSQATLKKQTYSKQNNIVTTTMKMKTKAAKRKNGRNKSTNGFWRVKLVPSKSKPESTVRVLNAKSSKTRRH